MNGAEKMLWVHLSCSGAVGWGTLAAKHECWDEWNHLLTDSDDGATGPEFYSILCSPFSYFHHSQYFHHSAWILNTCMHVANDWFEKDHCLVMQCCILYIVGAQRERESNCCQGALSDGPSQPRPGQNTDPWTKNHSFIHFLGLSNKNEGQHPINPPPENTLHHQCSYIFF